MKYLVQPVIDGATNFPGQNPRKIYWMASVNSGLVASLNGNAVELVQKSWTENEKQQWRLEPLTGASSGFYRIISKMTGKALTLRGDKEVIVDAWKDNAGQHWKLNNLGYGKFKIESRAKGSVLDVAGSSKSEGARIVLNTSADKSGLRVVIYEHANYQGRSQEIGIGKYNLNQLTIGNDVLSSLRVPRGLRVILFEHANFGGTSRTYTTDTPYVGNDFNDKTSSIIVVDESKTVTIYEHSNYQGKSQTMGVGRYDMGALAIGNDKLSSIKVPAGLTVTLYEHAGFQGRTKTVAGDMAYIGGDFNDRASSLVVSAIESPIQSLSEGAVLSQQWLLAEVCDNRLESTYNKRATIYEHANYQGRSQELGPGSYLMKDLKIGNDTLSSLKVPEGIRVTLFEHENFRGRIKIFSENTSFVGSDFNDLTSSILVEPVAAIYEHANFGGAKQVIGVGSYKMSDLSIGNDRISSIKVPQGLIVTLYEHANFNGRTKTFLEDASYVGDDFNDKTSSISVKAMGVVIPNDAIRYGSKIALRSYHGKYLMTRPDGSMIADRGYHDAWEHYAVVRSGASKHQSHLSYGDVISLKSTHGKFLSAWPDGRCAFDKDWTKEWEQFVIVRAGKTEDKNFVSSGDVIGLKSYHNKFMSAWPDGRCAIDKEWLKEWESWTVGLFSRPDGAVVSPGEAEAGGPGACGAAACAAEACKADYCGAAVCGAAAALASACGLAASVVAVCGADVAGISGCIAAASGLAACGADISGAAACGAAACGLAAGGVAACGADACGAAACAAAACGAAACGAAACGADACGAAACPADAGGAGACAAQAESIGACPADACAANACAINCCPADACAADACAIDVIPIIPFI
ncbi:MAG TPA: beta/gamma crystallin-related protein [Methanothrix sp.]|nr:beta/gamma crystallin-related protein [Methanothrix sp.]